MYLTMNFLCHVKHRSHICRCIDLENLYVLVTDDIVHKGTSKHHKTDEKAPIVRCTSLHCYFFKLSHYTQHPFKHAVILIF